MPYTGPRMPLDSEIDEVTEDILEYLKTNYNIRITNNKYGNGTPEHPFYRAKDVLRAAVKTVLDTDAIEGF